MLPKEIIRAILSLIEDDRARKLARGVCREWQKIINFTDINIFCAVTLQRVDQLRNTLVKCGSFGLTINDPHLTDPSILLGQLSQLTSLSYPSTLPTMESVTNLQHLTAHAAPADWLLRQSQLTSLRLTEVTMDQSILGPDSLSNIRSLSVGSFEAAPLLTAVTASKLTSLVCATVKQFDITKYSNLKSLFLRTPAQVNIDVNLPNLEELQLNHVMRVSSTALTKLHVSGRSDNVLDLLRGLTTLQTFTACWDNNAEQVSHFTALKKLSRLTVLAAPSVQVLQYLQPDSLTRLTLFTDDPSDACIEYLSRLTNLRILHFSTAARVNWRVVSSLTHLEGLHTTYASCDNLSSINTLTRLHSLALSNRDRTSESVHFDVQVLRRLRQLLVLCPSIHLDNLAALHHLEYLALHGSMDFNQLHSAHLTHLEVVSSDDAFWNNLSRLSALRELNIRHITSDEHVIELSVLTQLTRLSVSHSTNDGKELTRLTSLRYIQYLSSNTSRAIKNELTNKLINLEQNNYVVNTK